jgi:zinc protease
VVQPRFEEEAFQKVRAQVLEEVEQRQAKIECASQDYLMQELFSVNPYGHPVRGTAATLRNLQLSDVKIQYRKLFLPNQARLAFYHGGDENLAFSALSRRWGSWVRTIEAPFTFRRAEGPREPSVLLLDRPDAKEGLFRWGALGVTRSAREFIALKVLEQYLTLSFPAWADQVASSGQIRASAVVAARRMPGHFQVNVQAPPEYLPGYLRRTLETLSQLQTGQIEQQRFEEAKHLAANEMKQALEDPASRLRELLDTSLFNVGVTYISNYGLRVGRLTPETFQSALKEVFSNRPSLTVIAGPAERLQPELTELGKVRVLH